MGKVWLKTRFDNSMNMEVPHSHNMANAMYGFRELGAEIIPYHTIDEIYDKVSKEDIVLDYLAQCNIIFDKFGKKPYIEDYPSSFERFLGRKSVFLHIYDRWKRDCVSYLFCGDSGRYSRNLHAVICR